MQNLSKLALSILSTLVVSSVFAQCAPGSPCYKASRGGNSGNTYYAPSYDSGYSTYGQPSYGGHPISYSHDYSYPQDYPSSGYSSQPYRSYQQEGGEIYPVNPPSGTWSSSNYQQSWSSAPIHHERPLNQGYQTNWSNSPAYPGTSHQGSYQRSYSAPLDRPVMEGKPGSWTNQNFYSPNMNYSSPTTEPNEFPVTPPKGVQDTSTDTGSGVNAKGTNPTLAPRTR